MSTDASVAVPATAVSIVPIPAFADNYIWALVHRGHCVVVDPGDAAPVEAFLAERQLTLDAILITQKPLGDQFSTRFAGIEKLASLKAPLDGATSRDMDVYLLHEFKGY